MSSASTPIRIFTADDRSSRARRPVVGRGGAVTAFEIQSGRPGCSADVVDGSPSGNPYWPPSTVCTGETKIEP